MKKSVLVAAGIMVLMLGSLVSFADQSEPNTMNKQARVILNDAQPEKKLLPTSRSLPPMSSETQDAPSFLESIMRMGDWF